MSSDVLKVPDWSMIDNPISFKHRSDTLLITVGDSWTYGDSLGNTKVRNGVDDTEYRLNHVFGNIMSEAMDASWYNIALPGGSNFLMLTWLEEIIMMGLHPYNEITCVVTLTESGRHEELKMMNRSLITQQAVLNDILARTYYVIKVLAKRYPNIHFITAHNFTDGNNSTIDLCELSWLEVLLDKTIQNDTRIVISDHIEQMNYDARYPDVFDIIDRANARIDLLDSCVYCNKEDSRHPTEEGHALWAEYLLNQL
jgi:hypothetical protein